MKCPTCGTDMRFEDKDTSSGSDMRAYWCEHCQKSHVEDRGPALWQVMSDGYEFFNPPPFRVRLMRRLRTLFRR